MTTTQKRNTLANRLGRFLGSRSIQRSEPGTRYNQSQRSFLVDCGLAPDASDDDVARFAGNLDELTRAELDELGDNLPADPITRSESDETDPPADSSGAPAADPPAGPAPANGSVDVDAAVERALAQRDEIRRRRHARIQELAGDDIPADIVQRAYREDWTEEEISRNFLAASRDNVPAPVGRAPAGHTRGSERTHSLAALQAGLLLREGVTLDDPILRSRGARAMLGGSQCNAGWLYSLNANQDLAREDNQTYDRAQFARDDAHQHAGLSLVGFCREALQLSGRPIPRSDEDIVRSAMSTAALSAIFSTSINMQILAAYMAVPDTTVGWTFETDVPNFKQNERGRLTKASGVSKLPRGGTPTPIEYGDDTESYAAARYAGKFTVDEQDIIDNTLGGMQEHTTRELGELAAEIKIDLVYGILLSNPNMRDGNALFSAAHGNDATGLGWSLASYRSVRAAMAKQTENGRNIMTRLRHVIGPEDLEFDFLQLLRSGQLEQAADSTGGQLGNRNPAAGTATPHTDPRLSVGTTNPADDTFYAGSLTTWYGATERGRHGIEVGFRQGTGRAPRVEGGRLPVTDAYGMAWRVNIDVGAKAIDWRGLYRARVS